MRIDLEFRGIIRQQKECISAVRWNFKRAIKHKRVVFRSFSIFHAQGCAGSARERGHARQIRQLKAASFVILIFQAQVQGRIRYCRGKLVCDYNRLRRPILASACVRHFQEHAESPGPIHKSSFGIAKFVASSTAVGALSISEKPLVFLDWTRRFGGIELDARPRPNRSWMKMKGGAWPVPGAVYRRRRTRA